MPQKELNSDRRVRRWCFTLNNPEFCVDYFKKFSEIKNVRRFIFGHERGSESDTVHLQGYMEFEVSVRFPVLKKISPRAHWEPSAGTPYQNYKYCSKEGNFQVFGNWNSEESRLKRERKHGAGEERVSSTDIIRRLYRDSEDAIQYRGGYLSRKRVIDEQIAKLHHKIHKRSVYDEMVLATLRKWQYDILVILFKQNNRKVMWVYDEKGGKAQA
ncbi:Replication-associated protein [Armadillidium nasatum]|uniref:Replication-associated protein n=1 Tax=Armadillidium nasatum TaxID=96803 RepID=A0A5N5T1H1_9CRUS|nr:Replication-associated protein [Armadillidium nasatum]